MSSSVDELRRELDKLKRQEKQMGVSTPFIFIEHQEIMARILVLQRNIEKQEVAPAPAPRRQPVPPPTTPPRSITPKEVEQQRQTIIETTNIARLMESQMKLTRDIEQTTCKDVDESRIQALDEYQAADAARTALTSAMTQKSAKNEYDAFVDAEQRYREALKRECPEMTRRPALWDGVARTLDFEDVEPVPLDDPLIIDTTNDVDGVLSANVDKQATVPRRLVRGYIGHLDRARAALRTQARRGWAVVRTFPEGLSRQTMAEALGALALNYVLLGAQSVYLSTLLGTAYSTIMERYPVAGKLMLAAPIMCEFKTWADLVWMAAFATSLLPIVPISNSQLLKVAVLIPTMCRVVPSISETYLQIQNFKTPIANRKAMNAFYMVKVVRGFTEGNPLLDRLTRNLEVHIGPARPTRDIDKRIVEAVTRVAEITNRQPAEMMDFFEKVWFSGPGGSLVEPEKYGQLIEELDTSDLLVSTRSTELVGQSQLALIHNEVDILFRGRWWSLPPPTPFQSLFTSSMFDPTAIRVADEATSYATGEMMTQAKEVVKEGATGFIGYAVDEVISSPYLMAAGMLGSMAIVPQAWTTGMVLAAKASGVAVTNVPVLAAGLQTLGIPAAMASISRIGAVTMMFLGSLVAMDELDGEMGANVTALLTTTARRDQKRHY